MRSLLFKRGTQRYGRTPEPDTPFQRAGQLWDERIGSARVQARNWRLMAFAMLGLSGGMGGGLIWQSLQSRIVPYVVEVDRLGEARAVSPAEAGYKPTDPEIEWHLAQLITHLRTISLDPVLMRRDWLSAYDFATERASQFLSDYARKADPFGHVGEQTVSVQITSVVRASGTSFQVKWIEISYDRGTEISRARWTAILTTTFKPPATVEILRKNPLGLYVDAIDWSREFEPTAAPTPARSASQPPPNLPLGSPLDPNLANPESRP
jgi:type IV secretion system protein VirB5